MKSLIALAFIVFLSACTSSAEYAAMMDGWIGKTERELVTAWGVPDKIYDVDKDTRMLAYVESRQVSYPGTFSTCLGGRGGHFGYHNCVGSVPPGSESYYCETTFLLAQGRVSKWGTKGNGCRAR